MATCDTVLDNIKIYRGQTVLIPIYNISIDARYWHHADPRQFVPERFLFEDRNHHRLALMAFGGGHRACMGKELAWLELKTIIVRLMQRGITFEDTPDNHGGFDDDTVCAPKHFAVRVHFDQS
jgi:cytochrome P450